MEQTEMISQMFCQLMECHMQVIETVNQAVDTIKELSAKSYTHLIDGVTLCEILKIRQRTLYKYIDQFGIPVHKLGNKNFYYWEEVEKCLKQK